MNLLKEDVQDIRLPRLEPDLKHEDIKSLLGSQVHAKDIMLDAIDENDNECDSDIEEMYVNQRRSSRETKNTADETDNDVDDTLVMETMQ